MTVKDILFGVSKSTTITPNNWIIGASAGAPAYAIGSALRFNSTLNKIGFAYTRYANANKDSYYSYISIINLDGTFGIGASVFTGTAAYSVAYISDCVIDSFGNLYIVGVAGTTSPAKHFVSKISSAGVKLWEYVINGTSPSSFFDPCWVAKTSDESKIIIYTTGSYPALISINSSGSLVSQYTLSNIARPPASKLTIDSNDNIYITGYYPSSITNNDDVIIAKLTSSFVVTWSRKFGDASGSGTYLLGNDIAVNASGDVYAIGLIYPGNKQLLVKYNSAGTYQWAVSLAVNTSDTQKSQISIDASGNIYVCSGSGYIAKFSSIGVLIWQRSINGSVSGLVVDNNNGVNFGGINSNSIAVPFIGRFPDDGSKTGNYTVASVPYNYATSNLTYSNTLGYVSGTGNVTIAASTAFSLSSYNAVTGTADSSFGSKITI